MSNILDYLKWRGDLTFSQDSFCDVDNLILSQLVYVELCDIVPADASQSITLSEASVSAMLIFPAI